MYARYRELREMKPQFEQTLVKCKQLMMENEQLKREQDQLKTTQNDQDQLQVWLYFFGGTLN